MQYPTTRKTLFALLLSALCAQASALSLDFSGTFAEDDDYQFFFLHPR